MGRKALAVGDKLQMVGGAVPGTVKSFIEDIATSSNWTVSQTVRLLIEESPRIKTMLREAKKNGNKKASK